MKKLTLPSGTPRNYPPYPGATKNWSPRTRAVVHQIREKAPGVVCATYEGHGRTGEPWGIDIMVSKFNEKANHAQELFGDALCNWLLAHWSEFHINYAIWWNYMNDGAGWFDYEPYRLKWAGGSQTLVTSRHLDHIHISISSPYLPGNE